MAKGKGGFMKAGGSKLGGNTAATTPKKGGLILNVSKPLAKGGKAR